MTTFAEDIEAALVPEPIEAIVVMKPSDWDDTIHSRSVKLGEPKYDERLSWAEARPWLDYEYDAGYGGQDCHDFYAWTPNLVAFIHEYDGSTSVMSVPRNPPILDTKAVTSD